ncbi:YifB family Mg chelatase-like AAA ATPase [Gordonia desulfuricans]|uniref:YifB family Mg chelatase-like AAA ATPase n=1 Tax=Gordonia desulfuricans TaxID=89051 RepID=A0A7K3LUX2_9ACTN|nr:YifB family Mg chelatase-like AAA ATPase [Gordonia desulfuricans]NDK91999.1 YifB family Mg chelatase-like AAA ATPase [Gordonia desulfuricans]
MSTSWSELEEPTARAPLGRTFSVGLNAFEAKVIEVQAHVGQGLPAVIIGGTVDSALREGRERVRAAIVNSGFSFPDGKVTINLAPAELPKRGSAHDLSLAVAILVATEQVTSVRLSSTVLLGELALDGSLRPVRGILPAVIAARAAGFRRVVVPISMVAEATLIDDIEIGGAHTLKEVVAWSEGKTVLDTVDGESSAPEPRMVPDMADVIGQTEARHALEIAAAGAHHVLMTGPPGIGKTMLARRLPGILPPLDREESLEVTAVHSIAGILSPGSPLVADPPFIDPHHSASTTALLGGGTGMARPGAVSLAHRGVLFIDECAEMGGKVLDSLRQPLEEGVVKVPRRDGVAEYPARFQLILAANPCSCAPARDTACMCSSVERRRYLGKLSGPLMDRVDIRVRMDPPGNATLTTASGESSAEIRVRVTGARDAAVERWREFGWRTNAEARGADLKRHFPLPPTVTRPLELSMREGRLTARGADRAVRVAWTIADLEGRGTPTETDVAQALLYRDRGGLR